MTQRAAFRQAVQAMVDDISEERAFRNGLRIKGVQGWRGVFEMSWADDGRATFEYGDEVHEGETHIIWRRVGTHSIFDDA